MLCLSHLLAVSPTEFHRDFSTRYNYTVCRTVALAGKADKTFGRARELSELQHRAKRRALRPCKCVARKNQGENVLGNTKQSQPGDNGDRCPTCKSGDNPHFHFQAQRRA